jgi:hypothetical protein
MVNIYGNKDVMHREIIGKFSRSSIQCCAFGAIYFSY